MKVIIAGANAAKLGIYPIAPGPMPGGNLTNWVICVLTDKRARARAKERAVAREGLSAFVSGAVRAHVRRRYGEGSHEIRPRSRLLPSLAAPWQRSDDQRACQQGGTND
jgi:hypothetical protein